MSTHTNHHSDQALAEELKAHHAVMVADLDRLSGRLESVAEAGADPAEAKKALTEWIGHTLVPHAEEEEETSYRAASELPAGRLLIVSMLAEHVLIRKLAAAFSAAQDPVAAGSYGRALFEVFSSHQQKENEIILPLLVADQSVSLTQVMSGSHGHVHAGARAHAH